MICSLGDRYLTKCAKVLVEMCCIPFSVLLRDWQIVTKKRDTGWGDSFLMKFQLWLHQISLSSLLYHCSFWCYNSYFIFYLKFLFLNYLYQFIHLYYQLRQLLFQPVWLLTIMHCWLCLYPTTLLRSKAAFLSVSVGIMYKLWYIVVKFFLKTVLLRF